MCCSTDPQVKALTEQAILDLKRQGAEIVDPFVIPNFEMLIKDIFCGDFNRIERLLKKHGQGANYKNLAEIIESGLYLPYIESRLKDAAAKPASADGAACPDVYHNDKKIAFRAAILAAMLQNKVDAIIYPTWSNAPRKVGDRQTPAVITAREFLPHSGFPVISVLMCYPHHALPWGRHFPGGTPAKARC